MKKALSAAALAATLFATAGTGAANSVQRTVDNCMNAHAVLMVGSDGDHARYWQAIYRVVRSPIKWWHVVGEYTPMVSQSCSIRQYDTRFYQGGTAYVAHCGHGLTCNDLAEEVLKNYPEVGSPRVYCGEVPYLLVNPQSPYVDMEPLVRDLPGSRLPP